MPSPGLTKDAQQALDTILGWFAPILRPRHREKILRLAGLLALEKGAPEVDRNSVIEAAKVTLNPSNAPRFKKMESPADGAAIKQTYLDLESYYAAERVAKRWDFQAPGPDRCASEMKVLAFAASPRKGGNSDILVDEALRGATDAGAGVEKIYLAEVNINPCLNTLIQRDYFVAKERLPELSIPYCVYGRGFEDEAHKGKCVLEDDMPAIYAKIAAADAIVVGFPIYNGWENVVLTAFLERWDRYHNCTQVTKKPPKRGMLVSSWGYLDTETNDHVVEKIITKLEFRNVQVVEVVVACGVVGMLSGLDTAGRGIIGRFPNELTKAYAAGQTLVTGKR